MRRRQVESLAQALRTIGDGFHLAASALLEIGEGPNAGAENSDRIHDEGFIDQRTSLVSREVYLRLAREQAFPSKKIGKRVIARWGDVRAALLAHVDPAPAINGFDDENDSVRRALGFEPKGGS